MFTRTGYGAKLVSSEYFSGLGLALRILLPLDISTGFEFNNISIRPHIQTSGHEEISREDSGNLYSPSPSLFLLRVQESHEFIRYRHPFYPTVRDNV